MIESDFLWNCTLCRKLSQFFFTFLFPTCKTGKLIVAFVKSNSKIQFPKQVQASSKVSSMVGIMGIFHNALPWSYLQAIFFWLFNMHCCKKFLPKLGNYVMLFLRHVQSHSDEFIYIPLSWSLWEGCQLFLHSQLCNQLR